MPLAHNSSPMLRWIALILGTCLILGHTNISDTGMPPYDIHHDDIIKWKHFPRNWPFVWGIHRSPVNFLHKGQWGGALMFSLICVWINDWVNNSEVGDLRRYRAHYDVSIMILMKFVMMSIITKCIWYCLITKVHVISFSLHMSTIISSPPSHRQRKGNMPQHNELPEAPDKNWRTNSK